MRTTTILILSLSALTVGMGAINSWGVLYYYGFPTPWFCDLGLIIIWLRLRREVDYELEQTRQQETESREEAA